MYCSSYLFIVIATAISRVSSIKIVTDGIGENVSVYCDRLELQHIRQLENGEYHLDTNAKAVRSVEFLGCQLPNLPQQFLQQFVRVRKLNFSNRGVRSIKNEDFRSNKHLQILDFYRNSLSELPAFLFLYSLEIEKLDFSRNQIEKIDPNAFTIGVEYLKEIDLSHNRIKTMHGQLFRNAASLTHIALNDNLIEYFGLKLVTFTEWQHLDSQNENSKSNCMIFSFKHDDRTKIELFQDKLKSIELYCDSDGEYFYYPTEGYTLNIEGKRLVVFF